MRFWHRKASWRTCRPTRYGPPPTAHCLDERRELLQAWADMIDGKRGGGVVPFKRKAG